jgi:primosomal protein N'
MQLGQPVVEVSAGDATPISARVVVGTEAVWQRVRRCGVVIFVDFDQYLLAPRDSATRSAVLAVGKAGRLVGARSEGRGSVIVQTRRGQDAVLSAVTNGDVLPLVEEDVATARILGLAPFRGHAVVSGEGAKAFVGSLVSEGITPTVSDDGIELWSSSTQELCDGLATGVRSTGKLRLAVD